MVLGGGNLQSAGLFENFRGRLITFCYPNFSVLRRVIIDALGVLAFLFWAGLGWAFETVAYPSLSFLTATDI